ncbi:uncharacterized protein [Magallana gigas]|uniref:uncharacterized protein n=1 Tax=Magallana gigas TaxID=29159 RepID=UPI00334108D0
MSLHSKVCFVVVGTFLASLLVQNECRKLNGYKFPVYATTFCPRNETEWIERSSTLNCNKSNGYTCLPNENFDQLLEYCYIVPVERIQKGFCLYLVKRASRTQSYSCRNFAQGCHNHSFFSNEIYKYPACISLGDGCFLAEPSCKSTTRPHIQSTTQQFKNGSINEWNRSTNNDDDGALFAAILLGIFILLCILSLLSAYYMIKIHRRKDDVELHEKGESGPLLDDKIHSVIGTDCSHEEEECTSSIEKDKEKINQGRFNEQWKIKLTNNSSMVLT